MDKTIFIKSVLWSFVLASFFTIFYTTNQATIYDYSHLNETTSIYHSYLMKRYNLTDYYNIIANHTNCTHALKQFTGMEGDEKVFAHHEHYKNHFDKIVKEIHQDLQIILITNRAKILRTTFRENDKGFTLFDCLVLDMNFYISPDFLRMINTIIDGNGTEISGVLNPKSYVIHPFHYNKLSVDTIIYMIHALKKSI